MEGSVLHAISGSEGAQEHLLHGHHLHGQAAETLKRWMAMTMPVSSQELGLTSQEQKAAETLEVWMAVTMPISALELSGSPNQVSESACLAACMLLTGVSMDALLRCTAACML